MASLMVARKDKVEREELSPFECGFIPMTERRLSLAIQFFIIALIFLVFDVELILLFPFLFSVEGGLHTLSLTIVGVFFIFLSIGAIYEWGTGMLN